MTSTMSCLGFDEPLRSWLWQGISSHSPGTLSPRALKEFRKIKIMYDLEHAFSGVPLVKKTGYTENSLVVLLLTRNTFTQGAESIQKIKIYGLT